MRGKPMRTDGALRRRQPARARSATACDRSPAAAGARLACLRAVAPAARGARPRAPRARAWAMRVGGPGGPVGAGRGARPGRAGARARRSSTPSIVLTCLALGRSPTCSCHGRAHRSCRRSWRSWRSPSTRSPARSCCCARCSGPDPTLGARFYGIGNELKSGLAVLVLAAVAAALYPAARGRRAAATMACAARARGRRGLGADRRGRGRRDPRERRLRARDRHAAAGGAQPQARADRASAPSSGWWRSPRSTSPPPTAPGTSPAASSTPARPADMRDIIVRRYWAAWDELQQPRDARRDRARLVVAGARQCAAATACSARSVATRPGCAALAGGLTAGVVGALIEDSGPVLLVVAVVHTRLRAQLPVGASGAEAAHSEQSRRAPAERSRALRTVSGTRSLRLVDRVLESVVGEWHHEAAAVAHEMVMVLLVSPRARSEPSLGRSPPAARTEPL